MLFFQKPNLTRADGVFTPFLDSSSPKLWILSGHVFLSIVAKRIIIHDHRTCAIIQTGGNKVPTISMFFGILIRMYYDEHNPPHFHASYQGNQATFDMEGNILEGAFPDRQKKLVSAWAVLHKDELLANWELAREDQALFRIDPLR